jgi:hypothetical protein
MNNLPDDPIDPYESRLTRRVGAFAEQAVRPIDAAAIASAARAGAGRGTLAGRLFGSSAPMARFGLVLAGALVAVAAFGLYINTGSGPGPISTGPAATPTSVPGAVEACAADGLTGEITAWEGAAGHRIATVKVMNAGTLACTVPRYFRPALAEENGHALIVSDFMPQPAPVTLAASASGTALVDMSNYCGAAPTSALLLRLYLDTDGAVAARPGASVQGPIDAPPCNGRNAPATIEMQELKVDASK